MLKNWKTLIFKDWNVKLLQLLLLIVSIASLINVIIVYWRVDIFSVASFLSVWYTISAFMEQSYYLIINSLVICALMFMTIFSLHRKKLFLPLMTLVYFIYNFYVVITWFVDGLDTGAWKIFVPHMIITFVIIVLLGVYCGIRLHKKYGRKKTYY